MCVLGACLCLFVLYVCVMYVFVMCVFVLCDSSDVYFCQCVLDGVHLCTFSVLGLLVLEHAGVDLCVVVETSAGQCG